jgi:4-hydroxybenzoyl-CoA thioesterase
VVLMPPAPRSQRASKTSFVFDRPVRFEEVDAARIVFFPRMLSYCHEAMASLMDGGVGGGYAALVLDRAIGLPTVHVEADFSAPLRFGDVARIELEVARIGKSSTTFEIQVSRARDQVRAAKVTLVCACTDLNKLRAVPWPDDVRKILEDHLVQSP